MEYKIVTVEEERLYDAKERLMSDVNFLLKQGWRLQGGVSISCHVLSDSDEYYNLAQALVRGEDKTEINNDVQVTLL